MPDKPLADWTVDELEASVREHNHNYWVLNAPTISDYEYDRIVRRLTELRPDSPVLSEVGAGEDEVESLGRKYTASTLEDQGGGLYVGKVDSPEKGWTAYFVEVAYDAGGLPLKLTSGVRVVPDTLPFADKVTPKAAGQ